MSQPIFESGAACIHEISSTFYYIKPTAIVLGQTLSFLAMAGPMDRFPDNLRETERGAIFKHVRETDSEWVRD